MSVVVARDVNDKVGISVMMLLDEEKDGYLVTNDRYNLLLALRHTKEFRTIIKEYRDNIEALVKLKNEVMNKEQNREYISDMLGIIERVENLPHEWSDRLIHTLRYSCNSMLDIMVEEGKTKEEEFLTSDSEHTIEDLDFTKASVSTLGMLSVSLMVTIQTIIIAMYSLYRVYKCTDTEMESIAVIMDVIDDVIPDLGEAVSRDESEAYATIAFDTMMMPNTILSLTSEIIATEMEKDNAKIPSNSPEVLKYSLFVGSVIEPYLEHGTDWEEQFK